MLIEKKVKYNFVYNLLYQVIVIAVPLITTPYLARVLGPESIGRYSYAYSIAYYFGLFILLGVNIYGCRSIALARKNKEDPVQEFWNIYSIQIFLAIIMFAMYLIYFVFLSGDKIITGLLMIYVLSVGLDINWFFAGSERFKIVVIRNSAIKIITTFLIFILVKEKTDVYIYTAVMCFGFLMSQLILWVCFFKENQFLMPQRKQAIKHIKPEILLFIPCLAVSLYTVMDKVMLGYISGQTEVGYYENVEKIRNLPLTVINALGTVMLPYMSNSSSKLGDQYISIISKSITFALTCVTGMVFGLISVADVFVPIFYGIGYEKCIILYSLLLPSCIFLAVGNVVRTQFLIPQNKDKVYVRSILSGAAVNLFLNVVLIPKYQSYGAALATLCAEAAVCLYQCYSVKNILPVHSYFRYMIGLSTIGIGMCIFLRHINCFSDSLFKELFIKISIGIIYYAWILIVFLIYRFIYKKCRKV